MNRLALLCGCCLMLISGFSQSIQNLRADFADGKVTIAYDIAGAKPNQTFSLALYSSHDNFNAPLANVSGDVGKNIKTGPGKSITWDAAADLGTFSGPLTFKLKGEMAPLAFAFKSPMTGISVKRGKNLNISWEGGRPGQSVRLEVFNGTGRVTSLGDVKNSGQYTWNIPKNFDKGTYSFKLFSGEVEKQSGTFRVKARTPMLLKLLPILAVGGAAVVVSGAGGGDDPDEPTGTELPAAPGPN